MISVLYRARHGMRFVIVVVALAVLYLMLVEVEFRGTAFLASRGGFDREQSWMEEARTIAPSLAEAERQFSPAERLRVWRLGLSLGYASERAAALALLDQQKYDGQQEYDKARSEITSALGTAISNGRLLGLEPVELVPVRTHYDSFNLRERIEADETGLAARVGAQLSPWHKHLFLLGMHLGFDLAVIEISKGSISYPDHLKIGRHATIVGIPPGLWQPLAEAPSGLDPNQAMVRYRSALNTLEAYLVRQSEVAGGENTSPATDQDRP